MTAVSVCTMTSASRGRSLGIALVHPGHELRAEAERLIEGVYAATFAVRLASHFPVLIAVVDEDNRVVAAAGCRRADDEPLFLEQYLDEPIERALCRQAGEPVARSEVMEIGSLAATGVGPAAQMLFAALAAYLHEKGAIYAVATATRRLRSAFRAFGFGADEIAPARLSKLPDGGADWRGYFQYDPVVVWGHVASGVGGVRAGARV
ncbi:MAG: thermostable hemolysin [Alphaproteobacteria bacterium]|nr:thermostable hemolysin [Alphaproteobacteria bacterium]